MLELSFKFKVFNQSYTESRANMYKVHTELKKP